MKEKMIHYRENDIKQLHKQIKTEIKETLGNGSCPISQQDDGQADTEAPKRLKRERKEYKKEHKMRKQIKSTKPPEVRERYIARRMRYLFPTWTISLKTKDMFKEMAKQPRKSRVIKLIGKKLG